MEWSAIMTSLLGIPLTILPQIIDTRYIIHFCSPDLALSLSRNATLSSEERDNWERGQSWTKTDQTKEDYCAKCEAASNLFQTTYSIWWITWFNIEGIPLIFA